MRGNYSRNSQNTGRELLTPDEVRMLDNNYGLLFIRGERPVFDLKYNIEKHPNFKLTKDGNGKAYEHELPKKNQLSKELMKLLSTEDIINDEDINIILEKEGNDNE